MNMNLNSGMVAYSKSLSLHIGKNEIIYNAPRGTKFAVIVMTAEKPNSEEGIKADDYIKACGWILRDNVNSREIRKSQLKELKAVIGSEIADFFAGYGSPGMPTSPENAQAQLIARIDSVFDDEMGGK